MNKINIHKKDFLVGTPDKILTTSSETKDRKIQFIAIKIQLRILSIRFSC